MERNQFFYSKKDKNSKGEEIIVKDSFNINKIIRSVNQEGKLLVLLDDLHERYTDVPVQNKQGKVTAWKKDKNTYQSEIYIEFQEDIDKFYKLTNVEE